LHGRTFACAISVTRATTVASLLRTVREVRVNKAAAREDARNVVNA